MVTLNKREESGDKQLIWDGLCGIVSPDTSTLLEIALWQLFLCRLFGLCAFFRNTGLGQLSFEISSVGFLDLLLLFLQRT